MQGVFFFWRQTIYILGAFLEKSNLKSPPFSNFEKMLYSCEVKLGEDPQPPAVTNKGATLLVFLRTALKPVIFNNSVTFMLSDSRQAALHHKGFQSNQLPPQTRGSSQWADGWKENLQLCGGELLNVDGARLVLWKPKCTSRLTTKCQKGAKLTVWLRGQVEVCLT